MLQYFFYPLYMKPFKSWIPGVSLSKRFLTSRGSFVSKTLVTIETGERATSNSISDTLTNDRDTRMTRRPDQIDQKANAFPLTEHAYYNFTKRLFLFLCM